MNNSQISRISALKVAIGQTDPTPGTWPLSFVESIHQQVVSGKTLTSAQLTYLEKIEETYSEENLALRENWASTYNQEKRDIALKVAKYYEKTTYFSNLVNKILTNPDTYVVPMDRWKKFCENKYAKKVLTQYEEVDKFVKGQLVQIRAKNRLAKANDWVYNRLPVSLRDQVAVVLEPNCKPITESARGSKVYKILIVGNPKPIFTHESDLKKSRKKASGT